MSKITINIKDFRAISNASIDIEDITVITGVNASGKSTISRMLYFATYYSNNFDLLTDDLLNANLWNYISYLRRQLNLIPDYRRSQLSNPAPTPSSDLLKEENDSSEIIQGLIEYYNFGAQVKATEREQLGKVLGKRIQNRQKFLHGLEELDDLIKKEYSRYWDISNNRTVLMFFLKVFRHFNIVDSELPQKISILEDGENIVSSKRDSLGLFATVDHCYYIDTPMVANMNWNQGVAHWEQLIKIFGDRSFPQLLGDSYQSAAKLLKEIIAGDLLIPDNKTGVNRNQSILFRDDQGHEFPLKEAASGIKSFAIIKLLLMKGLLNKKTLLIIDEPEAHLHPQWIVEYAKLIFTLNRDFGVRFLIATHSTDMVQTLYLLQEEYKESRKGTDDCSLKFYLAEHSNDTTDGYVYKDCQGDIEPIFSVFNRSYDLMAKYTPTISKMNDEDK